MKLIYLIVAISLVFMCTVYAVPSGEVYNVTSISECYGDAKVRVDARNNVNKDYKIIDCTVKGDIWTCPCEEINPLQFILNKSQSNEFDFIIEYYIKPTDLVGVNGSEPTSAQIYAEANKRTKEFNNIEFGEIKKPAEPFKWPTLENSKLVFGIVGGVILFLVLIIIWVVRWLFKGDEYMAKQPKRPNNYYEHKKDEKVIDAVPDDIEDWIRKL